MMTMAAYGCLFAGQSPWARAWTMAYRLYARSDTKAPLQLQYATCGLCYMCALAYCSVV